MFVYRTDNTHTYVNICITLFVVSFVLFAITVDVVAHEPKPATENEITKAELKAFKAEQKVKWKEQEIRDLGQDLALATYAVNDNLEDLTDSAVDAVASVFSLMLQG